MITVSITEKRFGTDRVLGPISFEIAQGETVALVGPSGIGKSTLLRLVAGIDTDFTGNIDRPEAMAMVFQEPTLLPWRSSLDNLTLLHPSLPRDRALAALEEVGLTGKETLFPGQLSLGQQRRLALARAFAGQPDLLIMDEPFVSLDAAAADRMLSLTEALIARHQPATLFVTHDMAEATRLAHRTLTLETGPNGAQLAGKTKDRTT
ncbi:Aliphatic sulfonates import ATP-binding protein SsuB [Roseovarius sp. THAF8]|uniref:ABC transporter ATP-binding protein n=1 Tax=Roseovarius sp. THAF8 TaxID=2587846 RepID=UPI0012678838|nr:ABC transporter ATP-binding protein [Roseovarius sp. THAF8]QFT99163.1 Aliphatic sulfonates import ATP-binding protein SsuB [Roseovarius sp. THAF8]